LSVVVLRRTGDLMAQPDGQSGAIGAAASALWVCWWFVLILTVLDPHLTRGSGDLLFMLMGITTGRLSVQRR
jgi:hypothetical protein